jgi:predicted phosphoribosyltransferase
MIFQNRIQTGEKRVQALKAHDLAGPVVLALPGGIPVDIII